MTGGKEQAPSAVFAPAKVNFSLEVRGRRDDGFHDLATWMIALDVGDRLSLDVGAGAEASALRVELGGEFASDDIPTDERNLAVRALHLARERAEELGHGCARLPLVLQLEKGVPSQAGLGGASSDASAALEVFEARFAIDLGAAWRRDVLARLGSDCVFFEEARNHPVARCEGRGERITERVAIAPDWSIVLVTPDVRCPTPAVFAALEFPLSAPPQMPIVQSDMFTARARDARRWSFNHLETAAAHEFPEIARWRALLQSATDVRFVLSGSGSSFFGLFDDGNDARTALERIRTEALKKKAKWRLAQVARAWRNA